MGKARTAMVAAIAAAMIASAGTPAFADADWAVTSTGLTDGQAVGPYLRFHPTWTDGADITKIEVYGDGKLHRTVTNWAAGLQAPIFGLADGTDVLVTVRAYDATGTWAEAS